MNLKHSHSFRRDDAAKQYVLTVAGLSRPIEYRFDFHTICGKAAIAMAQLAEVGNVDRAALAGIAEYTNRMDLMADAFHEAPLWKRIWWALVNDLPYVAKEE